MSDKKHLQEEEVDLGNLFTVIGKGISNLFKVFIHFFNTLFHYCILLLIFFKKHFFKLIAAIVLGGVFGYLLEYSKPKEYGSELIVETNFGSGLRLYNQIEYLSDLIKKKDTIALSKSLNLPLDKVSPITKIEITAYQPKQNLLLAYDEFVKTTDTVFTKHFTVEDYKKRQAEYDYRYHLIKIHSKLNTVFHEITPGLIKLVENDYYKNRRDISKDELMQKKIILQKNLIQIDSLRSLYKAVAIREAEKQTSRSTIEISQKESDKSEKDIELFQTSNQILIQLTKLNINISRKNNIVNIISDFNEIGVLDNKLTGKKYFQFALLFGGLLLGFILLLKINNYIENYKN